VFNEKHMREREREQKKSGERKMIKRLREMERE
jgi:hypothetical protein